MKALRVLMTNAAMEQALKKRYDRDLDEDKIPDIIFIDGGKGATTVP